MFFCAHNYLHGLTIDTEKVLSNLYHRVLLDLSPLLTIIIIIRIAAALLLSNLHLKNGGALLSRNISYLEIQRNGY